jgi:hypothetical protein
MSYSKDIPAPFHQQDTDYYCGAACAQMVLDCCGVGIKDQDILYNSNHTNTHYDIGVWATPPDGLTYTLNHQQSANFFCEESLATEDLISHKIADTIEMFPAPPVALVYGAMHWVVVKGMTVSQKPVNWYDNSFTISQFRIHDPWPPVPSFYSHTGTPPPHSVTDQCGTGGDRGTANQLINYSYWQSTYMTGANYSSTGHWQGKFVGVCDPEPPPTRPGSTAPVIHRYDGVKILEKTTVLRLAEEAIEDSDTIPNEEVWRSPLRTIKPDQPILVSRLDRQDEHYYIVPLVGKERAATVAMTIDARFGDVQQVTYFPQPEERLVRLPTNKTLMNLVSGKKFELENRAGTLSIREDLVEILNHWFWIPCRESLSPMWPFRLAYYPGHWLYIRIDGHVFTQLHTDELGL